MKYLFSIIALLGTIYLGLFSNQVHAQVTKSVSFTNGAIGVQGNNPQQLNNLQSFQTLQLSKAYFIQNSATNQFTAQGNDIPGTLRIISNTNRFLDIEGAIVWREGNNPKYIGFIPNPATSLSINLSTIGGSSYTITQNSNFAIVFNNQSYTFTNNGSESGNAATSSVLSDLNAYLTTFNAARPAGPVTVATQTTSSTTPTITGTATLGSGETLSIELNGVVYTTSTGVSISGTTWSFTVPTALSAGTYNVVATISNTGGYTLSDTSTGELVISSVNFAGLGCITIVASGGDAENSTWSYANNTIIPTSATAVSLNVADVLAKMTLGNLKIESSCITVSGALAYTGAGTPGLTLGRVGSTNTIVINAAITTKGPIESYSNLITTNANLTTSTAATISLLGNSGLRFGNAGITLQSAGGDLILSSDYDANSLGNIIAEGDLTLTSNGGAIRLGGGPTATNFAYGTGATSRNETPGIWVKGAVAINSSNGDISIKGYAAAATPGNSSILPAWGIGLGFNGTSYQAISGQFAVSLTSGTGKIYLEGWGRNPNASSGGSPAGILFNNWEGTTTQPLTINSANTTADAIKLIGNTENTANGQRYKNSLRFFSSANSITATGAGGGITLSGKTFAGNDHPQIAWGGGNILATSGPIVISTENNGLLLEGDMFVGSKSGVTGNTTSSSPIRFSIDNYSVDTGKAAKIASTGQLTMEPFGASFKNYLSAVVPFSTASGWSFNENSQTLTGLTIGKAATTSAITLGSATTVSGPVSVYGGNITLDGNITTSSGNSTGDILLKATGDVIQNASRTLTTNGGDVVFWSDSDGNSNGAITIGNDATINTANGSTTSGLTGGGNIVLAGGADDGTTGGTASDGYPDGFAFNPSGNGIKLGTTTAANTLMYSGGGDIILRGRSTFTAGTALERIGLYQTGKWTVNAGKGAISIAGTAADFYGVNFTNPADNLATGAKHLTLVSDKVSGDAIKITGSSTGNYGVVFNYNNPKEILATGGGNISITGTAGSNFGIFLQNQDILATSGTITLDGGTRGIKTTSNGARFGFKAGTQITSSTSNVVLSADLFTIDNLVTGYTTGVNTSGTLTLQPSSASFSNAVTLPSPNLTLGAGISGLTLGKTTNTSGVTLGAAATIAGPITIHGGALAIDAAATATNSSITLNASGAVTQTAALTATGLNLSGTGTFTLNNSGNAIATLAGGDNTTKLGSLSFTDAAGGLAIGTVGSKTGITATGTVLVETLAGDLTLGANVSTTNTTANAITLNAGKSTAIGTTTGGNILVSGTPTLTTGTGGIVKLFSGSDAGSTGLTALAGGTSNRRDGVDETTSTFSPALTANGTFALYRTAVQLVAPVITSFAPTTAGTGETVVITGTGFAGATVVKFGNVNAASFVVNSSTQITAVVGSGGSGDVLVQNAAGSDTEAGFIYKVVELKFEGNALDQTGAGRNGTVVGTATYGAGASGQAICFSNNNVVRGTSVQNYLTLPNDLIRDRGSNFTISLRFKTSTYGAILGYQSAAVGAARSEWVPILYVQSDGKLNANLWQGSVLNVTSTSRVDDGNWHKVEFSAAPGSITVYIDGVLAGTSTGTINHLSMNFNQLGAATTEGVWAGDPIDGWFGFNGCIDEFIIVDKSLTASQIQQVTALPQPTITSFAPTTAKSGETVTITGTNLSGTSAVKLGGVAARSFTIVSATEVRAIVGKDASLTTDVEVTTAAGAVNAPNFAFDCTNNALDFDGINDHVIIGDQIESFGALTQEAWVYWKGSSAIYTEIFTKDLVSAFTITSGNRLHANFGNGSNWGAGVNSTTLIPLNTWTHVAVTRSAAGVVKMYINGVLDVSTAILNLSGGNAAIRAIGAKPVGATNYGSFNGAIDELKVWNTERTAAQIQGGMNSELVGDGAGLVAYYNFNQGTAGGTNTGITTLNNLTPAVNLSGTLTNLAGSGPTSNFVRGVWPVIITQPVSSSSVCAGSGSLTVSAVGSQLTYQWYSNASASNSGGAAISGATAATLTIPSTATGTNYYYVVVSGACSQSVTSTVSTVTVTPAPVAPVADAAQLFCGSAPTLYKFARIVFSDVKSFGSANSIQVAEWRWLTGNTVISQSGTTVTNPGGSNPSGEGPQNIYDGNTSSKWLDFNIKLGNNTSTLQFAFPGQGFEITGYSWTTANDSEERDPRSWKVFMSVDGTNWTEVDSRTGIAAPSGRFTSAGSWSYATPVGGSNAGGLTATALAGHTLKWYTVATGGIGTSTAPSVDASNPGVFTYYVSQVNAGGCESTRTAITATVAPLPVMTYAPTIRLERSLAISSITPTTTGAAIVLYGVSPALPQGLSIDSTTGVISGTPTTTSAATTYTVSGTTAAGCVGTATFSLEVFLPLAPSALSYSPATQTVRQGTAITAMTPTISGGAPTYTISPSLPAGLSINATTGVISGTLTAAQTGTVTYTITATNSGGSTTATVSLVFNTAPTAIALAPATVAENAASGTTVGTLSATDADTGDTFTFALVSGTSDTDNASFTVDGTSLKTAAVFDFETKNGYSVRVRVTDAGGLTFERQLIISVTDENEDRDGDGVKDNEEAADGTDPLDACSFKIASQNATPSDAWKAADCDNDGLTNQQEKDLGTDPLKADTDGDGVPDGVEVTDGTDPLDASKYKDTDGDLVPNFVETAEGTATGDALKYKDSDKDGVPDYIELRDGTNPNSASSFKDTDGGGVPDYVEVTLFPNLGLAATNATQRGDDEQDTDGDGVPDYQEVLAGDSPTDASDFLDTDGDGVPDFVERKQGTDPNNSKDAKDSDGDGVPDHVQVRSIQLSVLKQLNLAWGTKNHLAQLPTTVEVGIYSGEKTNFEVVWNKTETVNILKRGTYELKGTIVLPKGYYNPYLVNGVIRVTVLPKPAPRDLTITKDTFVGSTTQFFISVGDFVVNDPVDNIHVVSLLGDGYDNKYFEIKSNILFWSSADRAPGKTTFSIVVRVTDRDGNTLDKFFTINRTRPAFDSLTIYNTFTPNADRFNDTWGVPEVRFYEGARISVYERGGARVFYTENPDVRWDGTYEGKEMPVGSYYWVIQIDETGATRRGIVNLLRK